MSGDGGVNWGGDGCGGGSDGGRWRCIWVVVEVQVDGEEWWWW